MGCWGPGVCRARLRLFIKKQPSLSVSSWYPGWLTSHELQSIGRHSPPFPTHKRTRAAVAL